MKTKLSIYIPLFIIITLICQNNTSAFGQSVYQPYSFDFNQKFSADLYSTQTRILSSVKTNFIDDTLLKHTYDSIMNAYPGKNRLLNEHLIDTKSNGSTFYGDLLPDFEVGHDFSGSKSVWTTSLGAQIGGTIGSKFTYYASFYANRAALPDYVVDNVNATGYIPGQGMDRSPGNSIKNWDYTTFDLSYTPIKYINFTLGKDKTFIGDGYRSLLLSDYAANYPLLRFTATLGRVQYMMMWANLEDLNVPKYDTYGNNRRKWAAFHYVDWNVTNRFSLGYFNAMIAAEADDNGNSHGFDANYVNPLVFAAALGPKTPYPDNILTGFTGKYKIFNKTAIYAQLLLDRVNQNVAPKNTGGYQIGIRGADLFNVTNFNYLFEFNTVKPYTYSSPQVITNYTDYSEPLGDPLGSNFKEAIAILDYSIGRFSFQGQINYASFGLDPNTSVNYGQNVMLAFDPATVEGSTTGQGLATHLYYGEGTIAYLINPKYNLRFELGGLYRKQENSQGTQNTKLVTFGVRASFRQLYHDF